MLTVKEARKLGKKINELKELKGYKTIKDFDKINSLDVSDNFNLLIDANFHTLRVGFALNDYIYCLTLSRWFKEDEGNIIHRYNTRGEYIVKTKEITFNTFYKNFCKKVNQIKEIA